MPYPFTSQEGPGGILLGTRVMRPRQVLEIVSEAEEARLQSPASSAVEFLADCEAWWRWVDRASAEELDAA